jgi:hypothetical protein
MAADPEPDEPVRALDSQCPVVGADPSRPEPADLLEMKDAEDRASGLIGEVPDLGRQGSIPRPEIGGRVMSQRGVVLPLA